MAIVICKTWLDKIYIRLQTSNSGKGLPEHRLPISIAGAFLLPVALALYGWCARYILPLPLLLFSVMFIRMSLLLAHLPLMAYVVDSFSLYSASALTGVIVIRCVVSGFLPIGTERLTRKFGYGWGFTVLSAAGLLLALIPLLLYRYGSRWRSFCKYTSG